MIKDEVGCVVRGFLIPPNSNYSTDELAIPVGKLILSISILTALMFYSIEQVR